MDALLAKADAIQPIKQSNKRKKSSESTSKSHDQTFNSILKQTSVPKSLQSSKSLPNDSKHKHIANKKLRAELNRTSSHIAYSREMLADAELLLTGESGGIALENEMEKTWRLGQSSITEEAGQESAKGRRELKLDGGPYRMRYTRNGRYLAIAGKTGHVATFDWQTGTINAELQLTEVVRDITFLQDHTFFAVAQQKYAFIYDSSGVEIHKLKHHIEPTRLEFLPYHYLLVSSSLTGHLKYQDTSTGQLVASHRTKFGSCTTMSQNLHNAVIHLGHQNGLVTLWTPNLPHPAVQLLAHLGPVSSVSIDPSTGGRYMSTAGKDGTVKVWDCRNWKGAVREWNTRGTGETELEWSAKGYLGIASGGSVNVYSPPTIYTAHHSQPPLYLTHPIPHRPLTSLRFAPFQDVLSIGHAAGISSILVPGAGEANFDSTEADPFENKKARREKEVKGLLDKLQPDMITLDPELIGSLSVKSSADTHTHDGKANPHTTSATPFARLSRIERLKVQGKIDDTEDNMEGDDDGDGDHGKTKSREEREKRKMRGKGKSLKRYLRKQRKNVIDPAAVAIRAKLEKQKEERRREREKRKQGDMQDEERRPSALDRFKRSDG